MKKISICDIAQDEKVATAAAAKVKGGPHIITWDGRPRATSASGNGNVTLKRG